MDPSPRPSPDSALPSDLVAALEDACFRAPEDADRDRAVAALCRDNPSHADAIRGWVAALPAAAAEVLPFEELGPYRVIGLLGRGGFGEVYRCRQRDGIQQDVAVKVLKLGMDTRAILRRFQREQAAMARMSHQAIAKVFLAGTTAGGRPWFAMELVDGLPITRFCAQHRLPLRPRLQLFVQACRGVQHAHQKGVLHRDLKPSNMLVAGAKHEPEPKLIDFGIAHSIGQDGQTASLTGESELLGTPAYMAPEQLRGDSDAVDTRADVYSLGAVLYELLTGCSPHEAAIAGIGSRAEQRVRILAHEIPRPSQRSKADAPERAFASQVRGELDWIARRALAADPEERYVTVAELADDVERHLRNEEVRAQPPTFGYQLRKFVGRNRVQVLAAALVLLTALLGAGIALQYASLAHEREQDAQRERRAALESRGEVMRLAAIQDVRALQHEQERIWPPHPRHIQAMESWLERAAALVRELEPLRAKRQELQSLGRQLPAAEGGVKWVFADGDQATAWWHDQLEELIAALEELQQVHLDPAAAADPRAGWGIARRLAFALRLRADFAEGGAAHGAWQDAAPALARAYPGLELRPQMGLVPIGPDPQSGLWEFAHLLSGAPARRDEHGRLAVTPDMGVVLVLVPGGSFWMGCDADPNSPYYDRHAQPREGPAHEVILSPYFIAKHELAQPQWERLMGTQPSAYTPRIPWVVGPMHPVEHVTWFDADLACRRMGLRLPTEAQWERAARGGTQMAWASADDRSALLGKINVADRSARRQGGIWPSIDDWPEHDDGYTATCPVGSLPPNPFGLHEIFGNVWEWCSDGFCPRAYDTHSKQDPERTIDGLVQRSSRGGCFDSTSAMARAAARDGASPQVSGHSLGFRPARRVE